METNQDEEPSVPQHFMPQPFLPQTFVPPQLFNGPQFMPPPNGPQFMPPPHVPSLADDEQPRMQMSGLPCESSHSFV
ncbi:hypothetical protein Dimus_026452 [Dionaea muscipula]